MIKTNIMRGDIFYADLSPVVGCEQGGVRPVLILQNDIGNQHSQTTIVSPLTSQHKAELPTHSFASGFGLTKESTILTEQIRTIDKSRLKGYIGHLPDENMKQTETALKISVGLKEEPKTDSLSVKIGNASITVKEYRGQRVATFKDIDECHGRPNGTARKRFSDNRQHFVDGTDFFKITPSEYRTAIGEMDSRQQNDITLITESGYLMLVKSFTDDLAWEVQRQLVNNYFRKGATDDSLETQIKQERAHAMLLNAQTRQFKAMMQIIKGHKLSDPSTQALCIEAFEQTTGKKIGYRPECEKLYSTTQLAAEVGSNPIAVGKRATAAGLKTEEYGITTLTKSEHGPKQVQMFMYNEKGRAKIKELFKR